MFFTSAQGPGNGVPKSHGQPSNSAARGKNLASKPFNYTVLTLIFFTSSAQGPGNGVPGQPSNFAARGKNLALNLQAVNYSFSYSSLQLKILVTGFPNLMEPMANFLISLQASGNWCLRT
jgi:hypothetical protein